MSTPGCSLFQGTESIKVNSSLERAEEEEALEDQRRRDVELGNLLQNAFDDLDDDETTIDSTSILQTDFVDHNSNDNHQYEQHNMNAGQKFETELHQLNILLDSKNRELETLKHLANNESKKRDEIQKRLTIAEAELDRALASKKNTHELLVESKEKCSNLESTLLKLKNEKKNLEAENNSLLGKLETAQTLLSDVQRKYDMVERDLNRNNDRNAELKRKNIEERHRAEIEIMQQQNDQITNKLEKKTIELENMTTRYRALQNSHETMLVDKASKINDLNNALNEAQKKCEELLSRQDYFQENVRLQKLVANLQDQIIAMEKTIATLNERLEFTTAELDVMDSVLHQHNMENTPRKLPSQTHDTHGVVDIKTPLNTADRAGGLKDELLRALANVKNKREEIKKLQRTLEERNAEIKFLKEEENKSLVQITTLKEDKIRLENRARVLEEEFDELRTKSLGKTLDNNLNVLAEELRKLRDEKNLLEQKCNELENEKKSFEIERKKLDANLKNVEVDLEELKQEHESMKLNYDIILKENQHLRKRTTVDNITLELEKHKFLLKDAQTENDRLKNLYVDIVNAKETLSYEFEKLQRTDSNKQLKEEQEKVENLQKVLKLTELKFEELSKILEQEKISHEREIAALNEKLEKKRNESLKDDKTTANMCKKCFEYLAERRTFEIEILKLKNPNSTNAKEIDDLVKQLNETKTINVDLSRKLKMSQECQEGLIKELQKKANQFGEYMKSHSSSSDKSVSPKRAKSSSIDKCVATSPELERNEIKKIEARIRDEMAKVFAVEIKRYQTQLKQNEEKFTALKKDYDKVLETLKQRQSDVDILKQAILAERENFEEVLVKKEQERNDILQKQHTKWLQKCQEELKLKDNQHKVLITEMKQDLEAEQRHHNVLVQKSRAELQEKDKRIEDLVRKLNSVYVNVKAERQSMKAVMAEYQAHRLNFETIANEWENKFKVTKKDHENKIKDLKNVYENTIAKMNLYIKEYQRYSKIKDICDMEAEKLRLEKNNKLASAQRKPLNENEKLKNSKGSTGLNSDKENLTPHNCNPVRYPEDPENPDSWAFNLANSLTLYDPRTLKMVADQKEADLTFAEKLKNSKGSTCLNSDKENLRPHFGNPVRDPEDPENQDLEWAFNLENSLTLYEARMLEKVADQKEADFTFAANLSNSKHSTCLEPVNESSTAIQGNNEIPDWLKPWDRKEAPLKSTAFPKLTWVSEKVVEVIPKEVVPDGTMADFQRDRPPRVLSKKRAPIDKETQSRKALF